MGAVWTIVSPDQTGPLCRSGRDDKYDMSACLIGRSGCLSDVDYIFFPT